MTIEAVQFNYPKISYITTSIFEDSEMHSNAIEEIQYPLNYSASQGWREQIKDEILDIFQECGEENWDGYNARPISSESIFNATIFIKMLPDNIIIPDVVPEPGGTISFEWNLRKNQIFSISFMEDGRIIYAGIFSNGSKTHGEERLINEIPKRIMYNLNEYFYKNK